jgi:hypothetical protein
MSGTQNTTGTSVTTLRAVILSCERTSSDSPLRFLFVMAGGLTVAYSVKSLSRSVDHGGLCLPPCRPHPGVQVNQREFLDVPKQEKTSGYRHSLVLARSCDRQKTS